MQSRAYSKPAPRPDSHDDAEGPKRPSRRKSRAIVVLAAPSLVLLCLIAYVGRVALMTVPVVDALPSEPVVGVASESPTAAQRGSPGTRALGGDDEHVIAGAFHVHTTASDGKGDFDEVAAAASEAGLDYLVLADHNVDPPEAHWRHGVLMVPGVELSTSAGHLLAVGAGRTAGWGLRQEEPLESARYAGGMAVLAHPINLRVPWTGSWDEADGMEVVSGDSQFREALERPVRLLLPAVAAAPASTTIGWLHMHQRPDEAFDVWDRNPGLVGLCAHDAHGYEGYLGPFRAMQQRLKLTARLPDDADRAVSKVVSALEQGRAWCTLGGLADPGGFVLEETADPPGVLAGLYYESWPPEARSRVVLYRDGEVVSEGSRAARLSPAPSGLYRAEVFLDVPWIIGRRELLWIFTSTLQVDEPREKERLGDAELSRGGQARAR